VTDPQVPMLPTCSVRGWSNPLFGSAGVLTECRARPETQHCTPYYSSTSWTITNSAVHKATASQRDSDQLIRTFCITQALQFQLAHPPPSQH